MAMLRLAFGPGKGPLIAALGRDGYRATRAQALQSYEALKAQIPDTSGRSGARLFLEATAALVAFHRALPDTTPAASSALLHASLRHAARWLPRPLRRLYRWVFFRSWYNRRLFASVVGGAGFEGALLESTSGRALAVDYTGCALQRFLHAVGAPELGPHVCALDELESEIFDLGLTRTGTIGRGAARCDFRWRR